MILFIYRFPINCKPFNRDTQSLRAFCKVLLVTALHLSHRAKRNYILSYLPIHITEFLRIKYFNTHSKWLIVSPRCA